MHAVAEERLRIDLDRANYWQGQGAQVSDRVKSLLKEAAKLAAKRSYPDEQ